MAVCIVLICLAAGEVTVRVLYPRLRNYNMEMWRYASELKQPLDKPLLPFHHHPNRQGTYYGVDVQTNSLGFRDREYSPPKPAGDRRIILLGDSFTFGWGVRLEDTCSRRLERMLDEAGIPCHVINMGVGNYNSTMEVELFKWKGLDLDPDLVVLIYFINDPEPIPARKSALELAVIKRSYLFAFLFDRFIRLRPLVADTFEWNTYYRSLYSSENAEALAMNKASIQELIEICSSDEIGLLIVNIPELHRFSDYEFTYATDHIRELSRARGVPFVDLLTALSRREPESLWVSPDDPHGNASFHRAMAAEIFDVILEAGLLVKPDISEP
jgi:lysophospholipase L1-like esterase